MELSWVGEFCFFWISDSGFSTGRSCSRFFFQLHLQQLVGPSERRSPWFRAIFLAGPIERGWRVEIRDLIWDKREVRFR